MVSSKHFITLDLQKQSASVIVPLKYGETGKQIVISIADGGFPYKISEDCYAVLTAEKPDGNVLFNHCTIQENTIVYDVTEQTTAVVGTFSAAINLYGADDTLLISSKFRIIIDGTVYSEGDVLSAPEISALTHLVSVATTTIATGNQTIQEGIAATEAATNATNSANTAAENANAKAKIAASASETANSMARLAQTAAQSANIAATSANDAAIEATEATKNANEATNSANEAATSANEATKNANEAATKAAHTAKALMVVGKANGTSINLDDAIDQFVVGCRIFGKTTQDGTPTPDAPVELVSAGDSGSITVNVAGTYEAQSMAFATPNGLPGIPISTGGNYTDENGQQWICDEIDFARGVYVKRVDIKEITENAQFTVSAYGTAGYYRIVILDVDAASDLRVPSMCSHFINRYEWEQNAEYYYVAGDVTSKAYLFSSRWTSKDEFTAWLKEQADNGIPLTIIYKRGEPIETPLSEEEIAAYKSLHTYRGHTTVSNDAESYMELEYVMDAKKYIDSLIAGTVINATVE